MTKPLHPQGRTLDDRRLTEWKPCLSAMVGQWGPQTYEHWSFKEAERVNGRLGEEAVEVVWDDEGNCAVADRW